MTRVATITEQLGLESTHRKAYSFPVRRIREACAAALGILGGILWAGCGPADPPLKFSRAMAAPGSRPAAAPASLPEASEATSMRDPSAPVREGGFSEGLAPARFGDRYGYLDAAGRTAVTPRFDHAGPFSGGRAPVLVDGLWGYASRDGALAIAPAFDWAGAFSEGRAAVSRDGAYRFIDTAGDSLGHSVFSEARPFSGGLAAVRFGHGEDAAWGFVDLRGRLAIPPLFPEAPRGFREGYAAVAVGSDAGRRMGYIDSSGGFAMDSLFEAAGDFSGGLAPVGRGEIAAGRFVGTWHYIDRAGKPAFPGRFAWAGAFEGDYALAKGLDGGFLRIDRRGMEAGKVPDSLVAGPRRQGFTVTYELRNAHGVGPSGGLPAATE